MKRRAKSALLIAAGSWCLLACCAGSPAEDKAPATQPTQEQPALVRQEGEDPSFQSILDQKRIPVGKNSTDGIVGSTLHVNHEIIDKLPTAKNPIPRDINIHTLGNSLIPRKDFAKWSRWYQEDGNTQVFRLFAGERNVRNDRPLSARVEAFSELNWQKGDWHEWEGTYTIVKAHGCSIFQAKNNINAWSVMINLQSNGNIILNHRREQEDKVIASNMVGKSFVLKVRDNGHDYEVYLDGKKVGEGRYARPEGHTAFRWGIYLGEHELKNDVIVLVTGATFK